MRRLIIPLLAVFAATASVPAAAASVVGGTTVVTFFGVVGTSIEPTGAASIDNFLSFPITGGTLSDDLVGQIQHDGSGLVIFNETNSVALSNFIIDTSSSTLLGDLSLNGTSLGTSVALFIFDLASVTVAQLTNLANPTLALITTAATAGAFTTAFGTPDTTGLIFNFAATAPQLAAEAVPEPEMWAMMILGMGGVGTVIRVRQRRQVVTA